jgi:hypothetical protein
MSGKSVTFNSALAAEAVRDALLRSISTQGVPPYLEPWFYRMHRKDDQTRPAWGVVETQKFRLRRSTGGGVCSELLRHVGASVWWAGLL